MFDAAAGSASATLRAVPRRAWSVITVVLLMLLLLLGSGLDVASPAASAQVPDGETTGPPAVDDVLEGVTEEWSAGTEGGGQPGEDTDGTATDGGADGEADAGTDDGTDDGTDSGTDVETGEATDEEVPTSEPDGSADPDPGGGGAGDVDVGGDTPDQTDGADGGTGGGAPQPAPGAGGGTGGDTVQSPTGGAGGSQPPVRVSRPGGPEEPQTHGGSIAEVDDDRRTPGETSGSPGPPGSAGTGTAGVMGGSREAASAWMLADRLVPASLADIGEPAPGGSPPGGPTVDDAAGGSATGGAGGDTDEDASEPARVRPSGGERLAGNDEAAPGLSTARASTSPDEGGSKTLWLVTASLLALVIVAGVGADAARRAAGVHPRRGRAARRR